MKIATITCLLLTACGGTLLDRPAASGAPSVIAAAEVAGDVSAALELAAIGASLLVDLPAVPSDPTGLGGDLFGLLDGLLGSCVRVSPAGDGVEITLADGGCGIPETDVRLEGGLSLSVSGGGYGLALAGLRVGGVTVDGALQVATRGRRRIWVDGSLQVAYAGRVYGATIRGEVATNRSHTAVQFTGDGEIRLGDTAWAFAARALDRHLLADCYPKSGALELRQVAGGNAQVLVTFDDDQLGLDSDDTGLVRITTAGEAATVAQLPGRPCAGL